MVSETDIRAAQLLFCPAQGRAGAAFWQRCRNQLDEPAVTPRPIPSVMRAFTQSGYMLRTAVRDKAGCPSIKDCAGRTTWHGHPLSIPSRVGHVWVAKHIGKTLTRK